MKQPSRLTLVAVLAIVAGLLGLGIVWKRESSRPDVWRTDAAIKPVLPQSDSNDGLASDSVPATGLRSQPTKPRKDWSSELRQTEDYFEFVAAALKAVEAGDGRAAYHIGTALSLCLPIIRLAQQFPNAEEMYREPYLKHPEGPQWLKEKSMRRFNRCIRLGRENAFAGLPPRDGSHYSILYWQDVAIALGDPLAKADRAVSMLGKAVDSTATPERRREVEQAQSFLEEVVRSEDPAALHALGLNLINPDYSADPTRGVVLTLAACELGFDCSGRTPYHTYDARCEFPEECGPPGDWRDGVQDDAGAKRYARLYARAQEVVDLFRREDWEALDAYVKLDGRISKKYELPSER